jgi:hypothetical protein
VPILPLSDADIHQVINNNKVKIKVFIMNYSLIIDTSMIVLATPSNHHRIAMGDIHR